MDRPNRGGRRRVAARTAWKTGYAVDVDDERAGRRRLAREVVATCVSPRGRCPHLAEDFVQLIGGKREHEPRPLSGLNAHEKDAVIWEHLPRVAIEIDARTAVRHDRRPGTLD